MAARNKPFEQFGPYILFRKLESDALGETWRAGQIEDGRLGRTVALRRLPGGDRPALGASAVRAGTIVPQLTGTSFAREQVAGTVDGVPFVAWQYGGGRSLRYILDRSRGGPDAPRNPLPLDQAIVVAEKVALSLSTIGDLRESSGDRLSHGALLPQFVWITDEGEIRVAGQQFGPGIVASLSDPRVAAECAGYFAPETRVSGQLAKNADVYALGAMLYVLTTGQEPPDAVNASAFTTAVRAAKTTAGEPLPDDIRSVLDRTFNIDPSRRYPTIAEARQAVSALAHSGRYSASTFNLAFYLSNLLKKEIEAEPAELEKEAKVSIAPYLEVSRPTPPPQKPVAPAPPMFSSSIEQPKKKGGMAVIAGAAVVVIALAAGGWFMLSRRAPAPAAAPNVAAAQVAPKPVPRQPVLADPIVASATPETTTSDAAATTTDAESQKKAFEDAVRQRLQAEMLKLQNDYMAELKQKQSKNAPVASAPPAAAPVEERPAVSAAQLDQQRREAAPRTEPQAETPPAAAAPASAAPAVAQPAAQVPAPARQQPVIQEGDVVDFASLDSMPRPLRAITPVYPSIARQQKISATVFMTVFVTETGEVGEVKVLRGDPRFGINDAAVRAIRATRFSPPMKDGKRVRTWFPQTIQFRP